MREETLAKIGRRAVLLPPVLIAGLGGVAKFVRADDWRALFIGWGYPSWMSPIIGGLEVAGAVAMIVPATRFWGALLVTAVMTGAVGTHIVHAETVDLVVPLIAAVLAAVTAWWTRPDRLDAMIRRKDT